MRPARRNESVVAGYGESIIEAPLGGSMPGYFQDRRATGTLDPLKAKAVFLRQGRDEVVIVAVDTIGLVASEVNACRAAAVEGTSLRPERIWIHSSHSHTGPAVPRYFTADADQIAPLVYVGEPTPEGTAALRTAVATAVRQAREGGKESRVELAQGAATGLAFYRRFRMDDGSVQTNPGRINPKIVRPAGEVDPTLTLIRFPQARAMIIVFGLHPDTVGGTQYSADYPHHMTAAIQSTLGADWRVLFLNAACGNINHIDVGRQPKPDDPPDAVRIGRALAQVAVDLVPKLETLSDTTLTVASRMIPSRLRAVPEDVVKEAQRLLADEPEKAMAFNGLYAPAALVLGRTTEREQAAEIAALRLGSIALVGMPGEIFVELSRQLAHDSPFDPTRLIGLVNGALGYIPTREAYDEGGYESGYLSARFEPGTGERWVKTALGLLRQLAEKS